LVKLREGKRYISDLRRYLVEHPVLVLALGFRPVRDATQRYDFDVEQTVPGERWRAISSSTCPKLSCKRCWPAVTAQAEIRAHGLD
jgi:hypothetical protein